MPHLICGKCNISYKIKNKREMNDFHTCKCGNELQYFKTIEEYRNKRPKDSINNLNEIKAGYFYKGNKKDILTLEMAILREKEEREKQERLKRDLNYRIKHAITEKKEKISNKSKIKNYKPLIVKELEDVKKKEELLKEMELLKEARGEIIDIKRNLKPRIMFEGIFLISFGFIWIISITFAFYLFLMAISTMIFASMLLVVSRENYYSRSRLQWIYTLNGINLAIFSLVSVIFIILSLQGHYSYAIPPIGIPGLIAVLSAVFSYALFCQAAFPDYPEMLYSRPGNEMHHIDKNNPIYGKRKVE